MAVKLALAPSHEEAAATAPALGAAQRAVLERIAEDGTLHVQVGDGRAFACDCLHGGAGQELTGGDAVLVMPPTDGVGRGVVLGRVGTYAAKVSQEHVSLSATRSLRIECGDSSIDLRADGKVMIRGEDVLVRAKGTKRIRAGTVSIN